MKKTLQEKIAAAREHQARLNARLVALQGRAKAVDRKRDTRRKIVVGAAVLVEMERTPQFAKFIRAMLDKAVTRPQDREAITDLLNGTVEAGSAAVNSNAAASSGAYAPEPSPAQVSARFGVSSHQKLVS